MKRPSGLRKTASLRQQLNKYAITAVAIVVNLLVLAQPSVAKVVYTKINVFIAPNQIFPLNLNHDGVVDFTIVTDQTFDRYCTFYDRIYEMEASGNKVEGDPADPLRRGATIGPGKQFSAHGAMAYRQDRCGKITYGGKWFDVKDHYLGLKFLIKGKTHYGWARLSVGYDSATLTGYAYETIPDKSIKAGQIKSTAGDFTNEDLGPGA